MAVLATQQIKKMRGGAQSHLMLGMDGVPYVVKFQNNPQHSRILVNEWLANHLIRIVGLPAPPCEIVEVSPWLIENTQALVISVGARMEPCRPGLHYGSQFIGGLMPGQSVDYLPEAQLTQLRNISDFAGMLVMDKWTCNSDGRQAVFHRKPREKRYAATYIDHGFCFGGGEWAYRDAPLRGVFARNAVYTEVIGWESFEPWMSKVGTLTIDRIWAIANQVPPDWYQGDVDALERLVEQLDARRGRIAELISSFRASSRNPFPHWTQTVIPSGS